MKKRKRPPYKPAPISEEALLELSKKYGVPAEELRKMAEELRLGKPRLEMHLIILANEARKNNNA